MVKKKLYTTPLIQQSEKKPLIEVPVKKPSVFRILRIGSSVLQLLFSSVKMRFSHRHASPRETAFKIRQLFEVLGGMGIKMGQVLSMRNDLFSVEFCDELLKLQDQAFAFPSELSIQLIEQSIGCPVDHVFENLDPKPFAAASLSQVHKAKLRGRDIDVAVKVQRPYARETFEYDFWWLSLCFNTLSHFRIAEHFHWKEMLTEIKGFMEEELDYRHEASEMKRMRKLLKAHKVYVPKVFLMYTTRTLLVMEFLPGVFMSDYVKVARAEPHRVAAWLEDNQLNPKRLARRLLQSLMRQMFEDYAFHGDLHPGNIILLRKNRIALVDFGNTGTFDRDFIAKYEQYSRALASGNFSTAADMFLLFAGSIPSVDTAQVKKDVIRALQEAQRKSGIRNLPFHEKSLAATSAEMNAIIAKYKFDMNWSLLRMGRTFAALDQTIGILNPDINYVKETRKYYVKSAERRKGDSLRKFQVLMEKVSDISTIFIPLLASRAIQFKGSMGHGVRAAAFLLKLTLFGLGIALVVSAWAYLHQHHFKAVRDIHDRYDNWFLTLVEIMPHLERYEWAGVLTMLLAFSVGLRKFLRRLYQPPIRLPGQGNSTHG